MAISDLFGTGGKRCPRCGRVLEHWQFNRSRHTRDGLQSYCKDCAREYKRKHPVKEWKYNKHDGKTLPLWK